MQYFSLDPRVDFIKISVNISLDDLCSSLLKITPLILSLFAISSAIANPEPPGMYDSRNHGMGGAGVAHLSSPAAAQHNPANLDAVDTKQFQANLTALMVNFTGSFSGPGNEQESGWQPVPLPFFGNNRRISERVTWGSAFYVAVGFGGGFEDVKQYGTGQACTNSINDVFGDPSSGSLILQTGTETNDYCLEEGREEFVQLAVMELAAPISYRVNDRLRLGVTFRFPFGIFEQQTSQDIIGAFGDNNNPFGTHGLGMAQITSEMFGYGNPGVLLGVSYDVTPYLTVAATYRSKITVDFSGDTNLALDSNALLDVLLDEAGSIPIGIFSGLVSNIAQLNELISLKNGDDVNDFADRIASDIDSETQWSIPKAIELGMALRVTPNLLVAFDWRHQYHSEANKELIVKLNDPLFEELGLAGLGQVLDWKDVYGWSLGFEYNLTSLLQVRMGYGEANSATPTEYTNPFTPPPGLQTAYYAGLGYHKEGWQYDLGLSYSLVENEIDQPFDDQGNPVPTRTCQPGQVVKSGCPGEQAITSVFFSFSAYYQY